VEILSARRFGAREAKLRRVPGGDHVTNDPGKDDEA
jgi:hypothetical protein